MAERVSGGARASARTPGLVAALAAWRRELAQLGGPDPLMRPTDLHEGSLDLAVAHPSGIAMLLAGRPTRLSHLFREPGVLDAAQRQARSIRAAAAALADEHGLRACVLAVGLASWREERTGQVVSTPVLLRPVQLQPRPAGGGAVDYEVDLGGPVRTNPALVRELARRGIPLDAAALAALSVHAHGFDPTPSLERLRSQTSVSAPDITVRTGLLVTALVDVSPALVASLDAVAGSLPDHDVVASLVGDAAARRRLHADPTGDGSPVRGADDGEAAAPEAEPAAVPGLAAAQLESVRVLPLDHHQRGALDAVLAGRSVRVEAGPGTGATQLAAAAVAALVGSGRKVLLVAGQQVEIADLARSLAGAGLGDLVVDPTATPDRPTDRPVTGQLMAVPPAATAGRRSTDRPAGAGGGSGARPAAGGPTSDPGAQLLAHHRALHTVRGPWGVSALDALHALARLPGGPRVVRTSVRLPASALAALDAPARTEAGVQLREAVELGALTVRADQTPWSGAALSSPEDAAEALGAVRALVEDLLPSLRRQASGLARGAGLREPTCVADCAAQLTLLTAARDTLDLFVPAVFERTLVPLVDATTPTAAREADGIRLGFWERRRLERDARDLLRPGVVPADLHTSLVAAEETRRAWQEWQADDQAGALPRVPQGVPTAEVVLDGVADSLAGLEEVLASTSGGGDLLTTPWSELESRLESLASDAEALEDLPRRTALLSSLRARGLSALLDDLRGRQVAPGAVAAELEHAWWRSVLDAVLAEEPSLVALDPARRASLVTDLAEAERERSKAAAQRVREAVTAASGTSLCRVSSPLALPHEIEPGERVDVVVLVAAHRIGVPEAVLAMAAGHQVLVLGDPGGLPPARVEPRAAAGASRPARASAFDALQGVLPTVRLDWQHRMPAQLAAIGAVVPGVVTGGHAVPCAPGLRPLRVRVAPEVTGRPDDDGVVESPDGEVAAVVDVVAQHARSHPEESLAVIAVSRPHARRVADALRVALRNRPELVDHLTRRGREPFVVTDLERCEDTVRDAIIFTVGYGLTPLGRFVHRFGPLDEPGGHRGLAVALTRARRRLTAVTCVAGADLEDARLRSPGGRALRDVLVAMDTAAAREARGGLVAAGVVAGSAEEVVASSLGVGPAESVVALPEVPATVTGGHATAHAGRSGATRATTAGGRRAVGAHSTGPVGVLTPVGGHRRDAGPAGAGDAVGGAVRVRPDDRGGARSSGDHPSGDHRADGPAPQAGGPLASDPLLDRLASRLVDRGLRCAPGVTVPDLVVLPAHRDAPAVAVLTDLVDDPAGSGAPTAGDLLQRELVLPEELTRFGWTPVRVGAIDLFGDPDRVARHVAGAAGAASPAGR